MCQNLSLFEGSRIETIEKISSALLSKETVTTNGHSLFVGKGDDADAINNGNIFSEFN